MSARDRITTATLTIALAAAGTLAAQGGAARDTHKRPAAAAQRGAEAGEQEHTVPAARVPAPVRDAFKRAFPTATVLKVSTEVENGRTIYEVESREGATHRDLTYAADGTLVESETEVPVAQLPAAVRAAAETGGARIRLAEIVVIGQDTIYEMKIRGRNGELKLRRDGTAEPERP